MIVRKRDGRLEEFEPLKLLESIKKAALAVEGKDEDIQKRATMIKGIKEQLMAAGLDEEDAEEQAEEQFDGYMENGEYTEYDPEEAEEILDIITSSIDSLDYGECDIIDAQLIQEITEKALMMTEHSKTAKEYIIKRSLRERAREMNTSLMKSFEDLTFGKSEDVETKRENANIDGDSSMGTMLKYGSEGAKKFNLLYVVPPDESEAHSNGDIHIHDLDFYALTETCVVEHSKVVLRIGRKVADPVIEVDMKYFDKYLDGLADDTVVNLESVYVWSCGSFRKVRNCVRHSSKDKKVLRIHSKAATIEVTDNHVIKVKSSADELSDMKASELKLRFDAGEQMRLSSDIYVGETVKYAKFDDADYRIDSVEEIEYSGKYVYDIETTNHYFMTNGVTVHNCCQIDLEKLFTGGFNTGHGLIREPSEIRSYAALACIAIQSNQNDQHKRVA